MTNHGAMNLPSCDSYKPQLRSNLLKGCNPAAPSRAQFNQRTLSPTSRHGTVLNFVGGHPFFSQGDQARFVFKILDGIAEEYCILPGGRRQIVAIYTPGDLFGFVAGPKHTISAEAVTSGCAQVIDCSGNPGTESNSPFAREVWSSLVTNKHRHQKHMFRLGISATKRIADLLLEMSDRLSGTNSFYMPMTGREIANYLSLTKETVSRTMTSLRNRKVVVVIPSRVVTINRRRLLTLRGDVVTIDRRKLLTLRGEV